MSVLQSLLVRLETVEEERILLLDIMKQFSDAASYIADKAFDLKLANKFELQKRFYREIREKFNLSAQFAIRVISKFALPTQGCIVCKPHEIFSLGRSRSI